MIADIESNKKLKPLYSHWIVHKKKNNTNRKIL